MTASPSQIERPTKFSPLVNRSPIYYGWIVFLVGTIGLAATSPGQSFSVSLFIDHYIAEFGLSRTSVSTLYGVGTFIASLLLTWVGRQIDLHGNRRVAVIITALFAVALLASSLITGPLTILFSFIAIRALGQGSLGLVSTTAVVRWFEKNRGLVMALSAVGFAVFQRFYVPGMQAFIEANGWRTAWIAAGLVMGLFVLPLMWGLLRNTPEEFGLLPDNRSRKKRKAGEADEPAPIPFELNYDLRRAARTPMLWAFGFARVLIGAYATALVFHQLSLFGELGYDASQAAITYGWIALMTAAFTLASGYLVDRIAPRWLIVAQMTALAASCALAMLMTSLWLVFIYAAMYAVMMGVGGVFDNTVWVNVYGREHQGAIRGLVATAIVAGTAIGPSIFGVSFDTTGSYDAGLWLGIVLALIALVLGVIVADPRNVEETAH